MRKKKKKKGTRCNNKPEYTVIVLVHTHYACLWCRGHRSANGTVLSKGDRLLRGRFVFDSGISCRQ